MLCDVIEILEREDQNLVLPHGFTNAHSYRGDYSQLAFEPAENVTVGSMLAEARGALGQTFGGYKGGSFVMDKWTECWLSHYGETSLDALGPALLSAWIREAKAALRTNREGGKHG